MFVVSCHGAIVCFGWFELFSPSFLQCFQEPAAIQTLEL